MKMNRVLIFIFIFSFVLSEPELVQLNDSDSYIPKVNLLIEDEDLMKIEFLLDGFYLNKIEINQDEYFSFDLLLFAATVAFEG